MYLPKLLLVSKSRHARPHYAPSSLMARGHLSAHSRAEAVYATATSADGKRLLSSFLLILIFLLTDGVLEFKCE